MPRSNHLRSHPMVCPKATQPVYCAELALCRQTGVHLVGPLVLFLSLSLSCDNTQPTPTPGPKLEPEQDLMITFGGFLQNGPENELLDGQCRNSLARDVLQCDIHNGFMKWNIREITFQVIRTGDAENERHYYRERVSIESLQTQTVTIKLGMTLPRDT